MSTTTEKKTSTTPIVFFDGVCAMCNSSVNLIMKYDRSGQIQFAPLQGTTAIEKLGPVQASELKSMILIDKNGTWRKSSAAWRILFWMGGIWKLPGACLWIIPYPVSYTHLTLPTTPYV